MLAPSFLIYLVTMVGETNRIPFDLPEGEGEIVAGHMTEYSSMKFAMFFLAEYINMTTVSALAVTLFLGGWRAPWPLTLIGPAVNSGWWPVLWFLGKVFFLLFCYVWLRGTLPRTRYDQLMALGWKILIPFSIIWLLMVASVQDAARRTAGTRRSRLRRSSAWSSSCSSCWSGSGTPATRSTSTGSRPSEPAVAEEEEEWDYDEDGELVKVEKPAVEPRFPVPPLDLPHYHGLELGAARRLGARRRHWRDEGGHRCRFLISSTPSRGSGSPSVRCSRRLTP